MSDWSSQSLLKGRSPKVAGKLLQRQGGLLPHSTWVEVSSVNFSTAMKSCFVVSVSCQGSSLLSHLILVFMAMSHCCWSHTEVTAEELLHLSTMTYLIGVLRIEFDLHSGLSKPRCPRQASVIKPLFGKCSSLLTSSVTLGSPSGTSLHSCEINFGVVLITEWANIAGKLMQDILWQLSPSNKHHVYKNY